MSIVSLIRRGIQVKPMVVSFVLFSGVASQFASAGPLHGHCDVISWGPNSSSSTTPEVPADYRPGGNSDILAAFGFRPLLNAVPPPSSHPNCFYEISDITQVDITFQFVGTMTWNEIRFGPAGGSHVTIHPLSPISFVSGAVKSFQFEPHMGTSSSVPGPIEVGMPGGVFPVTLLGDNDGFMITSATIGFSGNHYYVPEIDPATGSSALSLVAGVLAMIEQRRRRGVASTAIAG